MATPENVKAGPDARPSHVIRDDDVCTVTVGWRDDLRTFFAVVRAGDGRTLVSAGETEREIPLLSQLADLVQLYAALDGETVTELRHRAASHQQWAGQGSNLRPWD